AEGRLVLGPDCGTALIGGIGFGFANRVRNGPVGVVAASGTGIQAITSRVHEMGSGISQAIGTGGRDLSTEVGGSTARQALGLLARDTATEVIVLASKPPEPDVASRLLRTAHSLAKPVVVQFSGYPAPAPRIGNLVFTRSLSEAADAAVELARERTQIPGIEPVASSGGYLCGLFAGGTLALEALQGLEPFLEPLQTNLGASEAAPFEVSEALETHAIIDLGADEYTAGRLHPMIDPTLRLQMLERLGNKVRQGVVLLDIVLGSGSHPDPAAELVPLIRSIRDHTRIEIVVVVIGTDRDPQQRLKVCSALEAAGARLASSMSEAVDIVVDLLLPPLEAEPHPVSLDSLQVSQVINVGLESFYNELIEQEVPAVQMDWRPPGGGNPEINSILKRMRA
ncbi:MAG: acyl-CoA synthetase FdrA, partial [Acidobacteriota bacterium]